MTSKTVTVSNFIQLRAAARVAKGGDTILLAPGNYGDVGLHNINPKGTITLRSADPNNDAVLRSLAMVNSHNVIIQDIDISRPASTAQERNTYAVFVRDSSNLTFVGIDVSGSMNNNARDDGHGMTLSGRRLSVLDSTFTQLGHAVIATGSDYVFAGNTMTQVREGMQMRGMQRALVANNIARDFQADYNDSSHPDVFQVHAAPGVGASSDLIYRNNVMTPGIDGGVASGPNGGGVGGIFIQSETSGVRHKNILIENNVYEGNFTHGISVSHADNVTIRSNTVRAGINEGLVPTIWVAGVNGGLVENNVMPRLRGAQGLPNTAVVARNNVDLWDNFDKKGADAADVFAKPTSAMSARLDTNLLSQLGVGDIDFTQFHVLSSSPAARMGAGFRAVANIGDLPGTAEQQMAAWLPSLDTGIVVFG